MKDSPTYDATTPVVHQAEERRFVLKDESISGYVQYEPRKADLWLITDFQITKGRTQSQVGSKLLGSLLAYASSKNKKVIPLSAKVKYLFEGNTAYMRHLYQG